MPQDESHHRYEYIAHQINREDGLVNYRLTWTLQLNGFLFTALALVAEKLEPSLKEFFLFALPATGFAVSLAGLVGVLAANIQLRYLAGLWASLRDSRWPRPFGAPLAFWLGTLPSLAPVLVLAVVWAVLLFHNLRHPPQPSQTASGTVGAAPCSIETPNRAITPPASEVAKPVGLPNELPGKR